MCSATFVLLLATMNAVDASVLSAPTSHLDHQNIILVLRNVPCVRTIRRRGAGRGAAWRRRVGPGGGG